MALLARRRARRARRSPARQRLRRLVMVGALAAGVTTLRNRKIEANQQRFNLP